MYLDPPRLRLLDPSSGRQVVLPSEKCLREVFLGVQGEGPFVLSGVKFVPPLSRVDVPLTSGDAGAGVAVDGMFVFARALEKSALPALTMRTVLAERRRALDPRLDQEGEDGVERILDLLARELPSRDRWCFDRPIGDQIMMRALFIDETAHRVPTRWKARFTKGFPCINAFRCGAEVEGLEDLTPMIISPERGDDLPEASFLRAAVGGLPAFAEMLTPEGLREALGTADGPAATITLRHLLEKGFGVRLPPRKEAASELLAVGEGETEALDAAADEAGEEELELVQLWPLTQAAAERALPEDELDLGTAGTLAHAVEFESFRASAGSENHIEQQITASLILRSADARRGVGSQEGRTPLRTQPEGGVVGADPDAPTFQIVIVAALTRRVDFGSLSSGGSGGASGDEETAFRLARIEVMDNSIRFPFFLAKERPRWGAQIEARAMIGAAVNQPCGCSGL